VFMLGAEFRPEGVALHTNVQVGADTKVNNYLKKGKQSALTEVGTLRAGQMGYWALQADPELFDAFQPFVAGMFTDADGKQSQAIKDALKLSKEAGPQMILAEANVPPQGLQVYRYKDPVKAAAAGLQLMQAMKEGATMGSAILKGKPVVKADAETFRNFKLNHYSWTYDFEKMAEKVPQGGKEMVEAMKTMMGDGVKSWAGTDGKVFVQIIAKDWASAQRMLEDYLDGKNTVGSQQPFQDARKHLPAQAS